MPTATTPEARTRKYSQELARYTLRQFSQAHAVLDSNKSGSLAKLPAVYSRVVRHEQLASNAASVKA